MTAPADTSKKGERPGYPIESVDRALSLLLHFENSETITLQQASEALDVSRSTAYRLLSMLQYRGFVRQDPRTKSYTAGPSLLSVGLAAVRGLDVRTATRALLEKIVERVDETAHIVCLQRSDAFFLDCVEGTKQVRAMVLVGKALPASCTAGGKVLLANLPRYQLDALMPDNKLPMLTKSSLNSTTALEKELDLVRMRGYALDDEESEVGLRAVGMRVEHPNVRLSIDAAISVSGPSFRLTDEWIQDCVAGIRQIMQTEFD